MDTTGKIDKINKLSPRLLGEQIEEELLKYIREKPIEIGQKIPNEFELADMFGAGRSTIREAVKGLISKGVLEIRRGAGTYVISHNTVESDPLGLSKQPDKLKLTLDLFDLRLMLEPEIAATAARNATNSDLKRVKQLCDDTETLYLNGINHTSKEIEFHTSIAMCSKNKVLEILLPIINTAVMSFANLTPAVSAETSLDTRRAITDAILERDALGAKCAMTTHLTSYRQTIFKLYKESKNNSKVEDVKDESSTNTAAKNTQI